MKGKLAKPVALEAIEVCIRSFEGYVGRLDSVSAAELQIDYELVRRSIVTYHAAPNLRHGAQALIVIILGEMIRREPNTVQEQRMAGYQRAHRMMERLERSMASSSVFTTAISSLSSMSAIRRPLSLLKTPKAKEILEFLRHLEF